MSPRLRRPCEMAWPHRGAPDPGRIQLRKAQRTGVADVAKTSEPLRDGMPYRGAPDPWRRRATKSAAHCSRCRQDFGALAKWHGRTAAPRILGEGELRKAQHTVARLLSLTSCFSLRAGQALARIYHPHLRRLPAIATIPSNISSIAVGSGTAAALAAAARAPLP